MKKIILTLFVALLFVMSAKAVDLDNAWFKPALSLNKDNGLCSLFLEEVITHHLSTNDAHFIKSPYGSAEYKGSIGDEVDEIQYFKINNEKYGLPGWEFSFQGKQYYLISRSYHTATVYEHEEGYLISAEKYEHIKDNYESTSEMISDPAFNRIPFNGFSFKKQNNDFYIISEGNTEYSISKLIDEARWEETCIVRFIPDNLAIQDQLPHFQKLRESVVGIMGGAGWCGSLRSHSRRSSHQKNDFDTLLYRPWKFLPHETDSQWSKRKLNDKEDELFSGWGHAGLWNYKIYKRFHKSLPFAKKELATFYITQFSMSREKASKLAHDALSLVIASGFNDATYDNETELHKALLEGYPVNEVENLLVNLDSRKPESILTYAIEHPNLLKYLLERGAPPNIGNEFGKTPLMYAAQFNQLESAKLLLAYGANPNGTTTIPSNDCAFTIRTTNVTPLHYAVRNASKEMVELLLEYDAVTFIKTKVANQEQGESPYQWLLKYTIEASDEKNSNIQNFQVESLKQLLKVQTKEQLIRLSKQLILDGENQYKKGNVINAFSAFSKVLNIEPENERALSNMSLIALRVGALGKSFEASTKLIQTSEDKSLLANAWFNLGLACEKHKLSGQSSRAYFNGNDYCSYSIVEPFYQSLKIKESSSRKEKLVTLFKKESMSLCSFQNSGDELKINRSYSRDGNRLFALIPSTVFLKAEEISWKNQVSREPTELEIVSNAPKIQYSKYTKKYFILEQKTFHPKFTEALNLGKLKLLVFDYEGYMNTPIRIKGHDCKI